MADATVQNFIDDFMTSANEAAARTALGLGTAAVANLNNMAVTGGTINGTTIGGTTPAAGTFTSLAAASAVLGTNVTLTGPAAATLQLGVDHATTPTAQRIRAHGVTTGTGADLELFGGSGSVASGNVKLGANVTVSPSGAITFGNLLNSATYIDLQVGGVNKFGIGGSTNVLYQPLDCGVHYIDFYERSAPSAPAANRARFYCQDNGSGKTQLVVLFPTGAAQVLATEP